jgi:hypothetical protein
MRDRDAPSDERRAPRPRREWGVAATHTLLALQTFVTLVGGWGCASNPVPSRLRVTKEQAVMSGKGAPARVTFHNRAIAFGELIAASDDTVWILTEQGQLAFYPVSAIESVALGVHDNHAVIFGVWTALGSVSTISHGAFLIFTLPIWLVTGLSTTVQESRIGNFEYPPWPLVALKPYARFPQGAPLGLTAANLTGATQFPPRSPPSTPATPQSTPPPAFLSPVPEPSVRKFPSLDPDAPPQ